MRHAFSSALVADVLAGLPLLGLKLRVIEVRDVEVAVPEDAGLEAEIPAVGVRSTKRRLRPPAFILEPAWSEDAASATEGRTSPIDAAMVDCRSRAC